MLPRRVRTGYLDAFPQTIVAGTQVGFIHIDVEHLPKLQTSDGERRKRYLFVAIDRCSRSVHLAVKVEPSLGSTEDDETGARVLH